MWNNRQQTMPFRYRRWLSVLTLCTILGLPLVSGAMALAQERPAAENQDLRRQIEQRYQVLPIRGGIVLTPKSPSRGVRSVEVSGDAIAINGERVNTQIARDWLGQDADLVLPLLNLDPGARRALFGLSAEAVPPAPAETGETPTPTPAEDEGAADEVEVETPEPPEAPEAPEAPEVPGDEPSVHSGSRVKFGGSIVVEKDELAEEAVAIGGSVRVDGEVSRDAVAIGGPARINGHVGGSVVSVGGTVHLGPGAVVDGDVTSVGGTIQRAEGARIHGSTSEISPFGGSPWRNGRDFDPNFGPFSLFGTSLEVFGSVVWMVVLGLLTCLVLLLARRPLERVDQRVATEPWKAALVGLASVFLFFPLLAVVTVLLVITIIGCALLLLYPFLFLAVGLAALLGYAAVAYRVGRWLEGRFGRSFGGPYAVALVGVFVLQIWSVIGQILGLGPGVLDIFAFMFMLAAYVLQVSAWLVGFGAVVLSRFGAPPRPLPPVPIAPVPPPPAVPPATYGGDLPLTERWEEPPPQQ